MRQLHVQSGIIHEIDFGVRQELDKQIDIAIRPHFPAGGGPKEGELPDTIVSAEIRQLSLVNLSFTDLEHTTHCLLPFIMPDSLGLRIAYRWPEADAAHRSVLNEPP